MASVEDIENWFSQIELSNSVNQSKEKKKKHLVDLWKFSSCYDDSIKVSNDDLHLFDSKDDSSLKIDVDFYDVKIDENDKEDLIKTLLREIEIELSESGNRYNAFYRVHFFEINSDFTKSFILDLKKEIICAIKGEVVLYKFISKINKIPQETIEISVSNFKVLYCNNQLIQKHIDLNSNTLYNNFSQKWLVLVINASDNNCNYLTFDKTEIDTIFYSNYEQVFILDFYAGKVIKLESQFVNAN